MSDALRGVVVCHGELACALVETVRHISGLNDGLIPVSNTGCDRGALERRIEDAVGPGPAVVFVDMSSGSCLFAALHRLRERTDVKVVTGVNLAMLLDFIFHRGVSAEEAAQRAVAVGEQAIRITG